MTTSIYETLAVLPSGRQMPRLDRAQLEAYLRRNYLDSKAETARRQMHARRQDLYQDGGLRYIDELIDKVFEKPALRERRKEWARVARFNNAIKRIVNELSTVYSKPAQRTVAGKVDQERYLEVQRLCRQDERFRQVNRLLNLHRGLFVGFRVRGADNRPVIDIATPDKCFAVTHPNDPSLLVALILDVQYQSAVVPRNVPAYLVWTDHERFHITKDGVIIENTYVEHGLGRMPWVYVTLEPALDGFWPGKVGEDLVAADLAIWFSNTSLLKETKSAARFPVVQGDMTTAARGQAADGDDVVELPEGTAISSVDTSMDVSLFQGSANHVLEHAGANYGMSMAQLKHQGVQSAEARELMRAPIKELRQEQMVPLTEFEREFVEVQEVVIGKDRPDLAFKRDGWALRYGEVKTALSSKDSLEVFEQERRLGLTNTVAFIMERNGVSEEQAWELLTENVAVETARNVLMRPMAEQNGSTSQEQDDAASPEENGAQGQDPPPEETTT